VIRKQERCCLSNHRVPAIAIKEFWIRVWTRSEEDENPRGRRATFVLLPARFIPAVGFPDHPAGIFNGPVLIFSENLSLISAT